MGNGCAVENAKSLSCGAKDKSAEKSCCSGLVCHKGQFWKCVKEENMWCAGRGTIAKECGSNIRKAETSCCSGLVCDYSTKKCIEPPTTESTSTNILTNKFISKSSDGASPLSLTPHGVNLNRFDSNYPEKRYPSVNKKEIHTRMKFTLNFKS